MKQPNFHPILEGMLKAIAVVLFAAVVYAVLMGIEMLS
jgi:hypothetical protein